MLDSLRFSGYKSALGLATVLAFRTQRVTPLGLPTAGDVAVRPFGEAYPEMPIAGLVDPAAFPAEDAARVRRIDLSARLLEGLGRLAPRVTPPVPGNVDDFHAAVYTGWLRRAWPEPPQVPDDWRGDPAHEAPDVLARLAVAGPFASYLRAAEDGEYEIDVSWLLEHPVRPGLLRPGGTARFDVAGDRLRTVRVSRGGMGLAPAPWRSRMLERDALLAGMNEDLTTFRHNLACHLATLTPFAVASARALGVDHPVRRLLHHCFHTVLIGNRELGRLQLGGPQGFSSTVFSHDHLTVARMASDYLEGYDFWDFDPDTQFARRGTTSTPFDYPYRDNVLTLWRATSSYAERYLRLYFDDSSAAADPELVGWADELDALLPNGLRRPGVACDVAWLARVCATLIHLSTVEHDLLNNVVWDYSTLGWMVPTVVPVNGQRMDQRRAFDLIATLIGTWKPYSMLLSSDLPSLALDRRGAAVMSAWLDDLREIQRAMVARGLDPSLSYPANLNVSVSN